MLPGVTVMRLVSVQAAAFLLFLRDGSAPAQSQALWNDVEDELGQRKLPDRALPVVAQAAFGHRTRQSTYTRLPDATDVVATRDLRQVVAYGLLAAVGGEAGSALPAVRRAESDRPAPRRKV